MNRLTTKIALLLSVCLLGMNFMTGAAIGVPPCPPVICCGESMHHNNIINFAQPVKKCCEECNDLFCGLLNDPLKEAKPVQPSPEMGYSQTFYATNVALVDITAQFESESKPWQFLSFEMVSDQIPLYIAHLSLII